MSEPMIDVPVTLDKATTDTLNKMTKQELIERICAVALEAEVAKLRCITAIEDADRLTSDVNKSRREVEKLQAKLDKAESYVEQGRAMIEAVMERWHEYDV